MREDERRQGEGLAYQGQELSLKAHWQLKVLAMISYFKFHFFSTLADIFGSLETHPCTKLIHQSSPSEMTYYLVQESQIFAVFAV